ncbi:MAG: Hsp70 family protein, partial [Terriglobales bacterium]
FHKEPHKGVNPDEVVAVGAAVQAGVLAGEVKDLLLLDVTPLSLGIETLGGISTVLITRNTTIPTRKSETFSTAADSQTSVEVHVLQGERPMAAQNRTLGKFHLVGIPPAPRGIPQIEVTFDIDANGIVNVTATDKGTAKEQKITITSSSGLSKDEIDRMTKEAESHSDEDKHHREEVEARNQLDSLVYNTDKLLKENRDKVSADDATAVESALADARKALEGSDAAAMVAAKDRLTSATHKLAEAMYKAASQAPSGGAQPGAQAPPSGEEANGKAKPNDVIDAEYVDADGEKKG